jgi:hypothetical protein
MAAPTADADVESRDSVLAILRDFLDLLGGADGVLSALEVSLGLRVGAGTDQPCAI